MCVGGGFVCRTIFQTRLMIFTEFIGREERVKKDQESY